LGLFAGRGNERIRKDEIVRGVSFVFMMCFLEISREVPTEILSAHFHDKGPPAAARLRFR
jgi:hypothetical protein